MEIIRLLKELPKNPRIVPLLEDEIQKLVVFENCSPLMEMYNSTDPMVHFYLCKILELRIKNKMQNLNLSEEIAFVTQYISEKPSEKLCEIYALLGLYCWPNLMPSFYNFILNSININNSLQNNSLQNNIGYIVLLCFLENINYSTEINSSRRQELKKAVQIVSSEFLGKLDQNFAEFVIPIFKELLKIIPKNFDYSIVYFKASEFPNQALDFFFEANGIIDIDKLYNILPTFPIDPTMIALLQNTKRNSNQNVMEYIFKALSEDESCFIPSVQYWTRIFSTPGGESYVYPVLTEIIKAYSKAVEILDQQELDNSYFAFFSVLCKNYPESISKFLQEYGYNLPDLHVRMASFVLPRISKSSPVLLQNLSFSNVYLQCLTCNLRNDPNTMFYFKKLDFSDKDSVKLALEILNTHSFSSEDLQTLFIKIFENTGADEIKAFIHSKLGVHESFEGPWDSKKAIKYYYYLKRTPSEYSVYKNEFYAFFIQRAPFDRCFSIIQRLGEFSSEILNHIYSNMKKWGNDHLMCFNNDLLGDLQADHISAFIELEVNKLVEEWVDIKNYKDFYSGMRSLLVIISSKKDILPFSQDYLMDLVQIDCPMMLNRVVQLFIEGDSNYDTFKATNNLITTYNLPNVAECQALVSGALTKVLAKEDGPLAFNRIMGLDIEKCNNSRAQIINSNRKSSQTVVRNLIKDFKAKSLRKLYENTTKVGEQNFLPKKSNEEKFDVPNLE